MTTTLGVDLGGTKVAAGLWDGQAVSCRVELPTRSDGLADPSLRQTMVAIDRVLARAATGGQMPTAIGIGVPEYVSPTGELTSHEVIGWDTQPSELIRSLLPELHVVVDSDVRCAAVAEARRGAGRGAGSMLYVTIGTGVSAALVLDGTPWAGSRGEAIALGEFPAISTAGTATVETVSSGRALDERFAQICGVAPTPGLAATALRDGDDQVGGLIAEVTADLGTAIASAVHLLDPALVVVGGGVLARSPEILAGLITFVDRKLASRRGAPSVVSAALGVDAGLIGAALRATDPT